MNKGREKTAKSYHKYILLRDKTKHGGNIFPASDWTNSITCQMYEIYTTGLIVHISESMCTLC